MVLDADMERAECIASELTEALGEIAQQGEDMSDVMMGVLMFFNIVYGFAEEEFGFKPESVH